MPWPCPRPTAVTFICVRVANAAARPHHHAAPRPAYPPATQVPGELVVVLQCIPDRLQPSATILASIVAFRSFVTVRQSAIAASYSPPSIWTYFPMSTGHPLHDSSQHSSIPWSLSHLRREGCSILSILLTSKPLLQQFGVRPRPSWHSVDSNFVLQ